MYVVYVITAPINVKRQSEFSGLRPDTSTLIFFRIAQKFVQNLTQLLQALQPYLDVGVGGSSNGGSWWMWGVRNVHLALFHFSHFSISVLKNLFIFVRMQLQLACEQTINCEKNSVHNLHQKNMLLAIITLETTMQTDSLKKGRKRKRGHAVIVTGGGGGGGLRFEK